MRKTYNNKAWFLVLPVLCLVAFSAVIPLMVVVNYAFQDTFGNNTFFWVGTEWFKEVLRSERFYGALARQVGFTFLILLIEVPLGVAIALCLPRKKSLLVSFCLVGMALPLLIPWNVVGTMWQVFSRNDIGLIGYVLTQAGINFNYTQDPFWAWVVLVMMDVWHWTSLIVLLSYASLQSIPQAYYQAAQIDSASPWAIFKYIQLPKMANVLVIGTLLRFMDSFMIYTEPFVITGGGPGNATTFLSIDLVKISLGQFSLGEGAAFSIVYFLIILSVCWAFFTLMNAQKVGQNEQ